MLRLTLPLICAALFATSALSQETTDTTEATGTDTRKWHHALSLVGKPAYKADFKQFKWVNPDAPKGGATRMSVIGTFDSLNNFSFKGQPASRLGLIYDSLMATSLDEASTEYGLVAEAVSHPDDFSSVTFRLRSGARFHDGEPIKPEDVIFSLEQLKKAHPFYNAYYKNVVRSERTAEREVTFYFDIKGNRELPHIMGQLTVIPKHFWTAKNAKGEVRDITKTSLEVPLGSGPYKIVDVKPGRSITFQRVSDYWARDLPVNKGQWNFDRITTEYFRDTNVAFEAFKAGKVDYNRESSSKRWATEYKNSPAVSKGWIKQDRITLQNPAAMQAFVLNTRRDQFKDARVRRAFNLAFDFEWSNKNLFSGLYKRVGSYFENSELKSTGLPSGLEKEILETVRADIPPSVFTQEYKNPVNNEPKSVRANLKAATKFLKEAGYSTDNVAIDDPSCGFFCGLMQSIGLQSQKTKRVLRDPNGKAVTAEFLLVSPLFERIVLPYIANLKKLGIEATARVVDSAQYTRRIQNYDFDIMVGNFGQSESPGNEQRDFWGTAAADKPGGRNLIGIKNKAVDKLIERIIYAKDRAELVASTKALDRVLLHNHYLVPQWYNPQAWIAHWDKFSRPKILPRRSVGFLQTWWVDSDKAQKLAEARK